MKSGQVQFEQRTHLFIGLALLVGLIGACTFGWYGYQRYVFHRNAAAHKAFAALVAKGEELHAQHTTLTVAQWQEMARNYGELYVHHAHSSLAPYLLAYQAQALYEAGEEREAISLLERAVKGMSSSGMMSAIYRTKLGALKLQSSDTAVAAEGVRELKNIGVDQWGSLLGMAWYHLLQYAVMHDDAELAQLSYAKVASHQVLAQAAHDFYEVPFKQDQGLELAAPMRSIS